MKPIYLYICPFFPSAESWRGGFFLDAVKALMRDGRYDVRVMTVGSREKYDLDGICVYRFPTVKLGCSDYCSEVSDLFKINAFSKSLDQIGIGAKDIAVCHVNEIERMAFYGQWVKNKNPSCIYILHHHWSGIHSLPGGAVNRMPFFRNWEMTRIRRAYECADLHVFCSEKCRDAFSSFKVRFKDIAVAYNGVDTALFNNSLERTTRSDIYRIGCVGNFTKPKSQKTLIEAFALAQEQLPNSEIVFVGSGSELSKCQEFVQQTSLAEKVHFKAEVTHQNLPRFYRSIDLFVLPSYFEAFNCTLIEAWACGIPCITTQEISFKEVLASKDWDKWLFPAKNAKALAEKLVWAYETRPTRQLLTRDMNIDVITTELLNHIGAIRSNIS